MIDIVMTLVFSLVMVLFALFPAMKIVEWVQKRFGLGDKHHDIWVILVALTLSLLVGVFLRFA